MATIETIYLGELRTEAKHVLSKNTLITDAPPDNNGKGEAFSPTDLLATALGSCMMTLMGIYAQRENIDLQGTKFEITKIMASNPRRVSEVQIIFDFPKELNVSDEQKEKLKHFALTCPVSQSVHPDLLQNITFNFPK